MTNEQTDRLNRITRWSVAITLLGGLVISALAGLAARQSLIAQGVEVAEWSRALELFIPLGFWFEVGYAVSALFTSWLVRRLVKADPKRLVGLGWRMVGAFVGVAGVLGCMLFDLASYSGPGGFAEAVTMVLVLTPMTLPFTAAAGTIGALAGFAAIGGVLALRNRSVSPGA